jgi:hypothetical protein
MPFPVNAARIQQDAGIGRIQSRSPFENFNALLEIPAIFSFRRRLHHASEGTRRN